jgi:hypothetical protein
MNSPIHMHIAGVPFVIHSREADVLPDPLPCYESFMGRPTGDCAAVQVELELRLGSMPDLSGMERVFDGGAWSLFRSGDGYLFSLAPRGHGLPPSWMAEVDATFTRGTVYCDEILLRDNQGAKGVVNPILHRLDQLLLMCILAPRQGAIIHGAGVVMGGKGYLFPGRSGAGKTTLSRQFMARGHLNGVDLLSDDRVIVRTLDGEFAVFGTPWAGDAQVALNRHAPAGAILFLNRGETNRATPVTPREALEKLLPVTSIPWYDRELIDRITSFCEALTAQIPAYDLFFAPTPGVVDFLLEFAEAPP